MSWFDSAACTGMDVELFFAEPSSSALAICAGCPVKAECLAYALAEQIDDGIWGGLTEAERRLLVRRSRRRRRDAAVCGTTGGYKRHRALGEQACRSCVEAWSDYSRNYKASRRLRVVS